MALVVRSVDELIAAVPHMMGFQPEESLVVLPVSPGSGLPAARIDLPRTPGELAHMEALLTDTLGRHAREGSVVAVVCFATSRPDADLASGQLAAGLDEVGIATAHRLWTDGDRWADLDTGATGMTTPGAVAQVAASAVFEGIAQPMPSRAELVRSMQGDRGPVSAALASARTEVTGDGPSDTRAWGIDRVERFLVDGNRLSDADAARLLVSVGSDTQARDQAWTTMTRENAAGHVALWTDLTRRAPDEVRAAPAALLGFASWLNGDGARAWCALDQVPAGADYSMARLLETALQMGLHPREWDRFKPTAAATRHTDASASVADVDETYVPQPPAARAPQVDCSHDRRRPPSAPSR